MIKASLWCVVLITLLEVQTSTAWDYAEASLLRRALKGRGGRDRDLQEDDGVQGDFNMTDTDVGLGNVTDPDVSIDSASDDGSWKGRGNETDFDSWSGDDSSSMDDINGTDASAGSRKHGKGTKGHGGRGHDFPGRGGGHKSRGSEDDSWRNHGNETEFKSWLGDDMDNINGTDFSYGSRKHGKSTKGHGGRKHDFTGGGGRMKSRGPFGIEYADIDCPLQNATEPECTTSRDEEPGAWVCRTLFDVVTGKPFSFSTCIDLDESIGSSNDVCGCCGECPVDCACPCDDGEGREGFVKVLDAENPDDGGHCVNLKMAKRMTSGAGLLGPRHICDASCM